MFYARRKKLKSEMYCKTEDIHLLPTIAFWNGWGTCGVFATWLIWEVCWYKSKD